MYLFIIESRGEIHSKRYEDFSIFNSTWSEPRFERHEKCFQIPLIQHLLFVRRTEGQKNEGVVLNCKCHVTNLTPSSKVENLFFCKHGVEIWVWVFSDIEQMNMVEFLR